MILTDQQIAWLVERVNEKVNLPIIGEKAEADLIKKAILKVLAKLEEELPEEVLKFLEELGSGFPPGADLDEIKENTVEFLNKEINIPLINEKKEAKIFTEVVDLLFDAMKKNKEVKSIAA